MQTLTAHDLAERFKVDQATVYHWRDAGYLPNPIKSSRRETAWDAAVIDAWEHTGYRESFEQWLENRRFIENAEQLCRLAEADDRMAQELRDLARAGLEALADVSLTTGWRALLGMTLCTLNWWEGMGESSAKIRRVAERMAEEIRTFRSQRRAERQSVGVEQRSSLSVNR
jgi:predicted DNA-binding transcriptional regulator AlpA